MIAIQSILTHETDLHPIRDAWLWSLSALLVKRHFGHLRLVSDSHGARFLVDELGLPYDEVRCDLDPLAGSRYMIQGKWMACETAGRPFVHVEHDVLLFNALPDRLLNAGVMAERPEHYRNWDPGWKHAYHHIPAFLRSTPNKPTYWDKMHTSGGAFTPGIVGGNDVEGLRSGFRDIRSILDDNPKLSELPAYQVCVILDSCWLWARYGAVETLFPIEAPVPDDYIRAGYRHLWGDVKAGREGRVFLKKKLVEHFPAQAEKLYSLGHNGLFL